MILGVIAGSVVPDQYIVVLPVVFKRGRSALCIVLKLPEQSTPFENGHVFYMRRAIEVKEERSSFGHRVRAHERMDDVDQHIGRTAGGLRGEVSFFVTCLGFSRWSMSHFGQIGSGLLRS